MSLFAAVCATESTALATASLATTLAAATQPASAHSKTSTVASALAAATLSAAAIRPRGIDHAGRPASLLWLRRVHPSIRPVL